VTSASSESTALPTDRWASRELAARTFLLAVSHDLRSPISVLSAVAELLKRRADVSEEAQELVEMLAQSVTHIEHVIADLLDMERLADPSLEVVHRPTDLRLLVARCIADARLRSRVVTELPDERVLLDAGLLERILVNLLVNADRHNAEGGTITVTARSEGHQLTVTVDDEGPGIPDASKERVFDLFAHGTDTGHGVGLYLVRRFAQLHGGDAHVLRSPNRGARLQVWLRT
jgi:signal transduction histidine kinase